MTRVQLVDKLAFRMNITKKDAETYLGAFLDSIMDALATDGRVAKKPLTGEVIHLPVRRKPSFHAGKELRERVNEEMELMHEAEAIVSRIQVPENVLGATAG